MIAPATLVIERATLLLTALALALSVALPAAAASDRAERLPPSPYDILRSRHLDAPIIDAPRFCRPEGLDPALDPVLERATGGEWEEAREMLTRWADGLDHPGPELVVLDATLHARAGGERSDWLASEARLRALLGDPVFRAQRPCLRLELARLLLQMERASEAAAQLTRAERRLDEGTLPEARVEALRRVIAFWRAEILYQRGSRFDAHLAHRRLAQSEDPRLALAARLRLTDLSFDAGQIDRVSTEYEALLPRAFAFGASVEGWALRAAEAAIDAGHPTRALRWIEQYLETRPDRDARDLAEIRMADLDVAFDDPIRARKRLSTVSGRRRGDAIGALAATRSIDLGVAAGSPDQRLEVLLLNVREQRSGVRRYALGVLMEELDHRGDLDGALAVATRLAYEGVDPVVTPDYGSMLDEMLERAVRARRAAAADPELGDEACRELVRALGGRYGILIERASQPAPFAEVGLCFEAMELPWLAVTVYRAIARRFGTAGAQTVTLPLARSSLAVGEVALARRVATAALDTPDEDADAWRAILAEADFIEGRWREAARGLRSVLDAEAVAGERGKLVRMLALTFAEADRIRLADVDAVAERVPRWLEREQPAPAARASMLEAAILAAHAYRRAGRIEPATRLYATVERLDAPGALRSSARFWLGLLSVGPEGQRPAWGEDPDITLGSPWARYARFERRFTSLWDDYGSTVRARRGRNP